MYCFFPSATIAGSAFAAGAPAPPGAAVGAAAPPGAGAAVFAAAAGPEGADGAPAGGAAPAASGNAASAGICDNSAAVHGLACAANSARAAVTFASEISPAALPQELRT